MSIPPRFPVIKAQITRVVAVFDDVLVAELSQDIAQPWSALAHRIGRGLHYGLQDQKGGIPAL